MSNGNSFASYGRAVIRHGVCFFENNRGGVSLFDIHRRIFHEPIWPNLTHLSGKSSSNAAGNSVSSHFQPRLHLVASSENARYLLTADSQLSIDRQITWTLILREIPPLAGVHFDSQLREGNIITLLPAPQVDFVAPNASSDSDRQHTWNEVPLLVAVANDGSFVLLNPKVR